MTPQEILELSEPVEQVYTDVVAQLVSNICRHLGQGKELSTQQWEIKKLSELDALTNESIKIIQNASGKSRAEIKRAIAEAMGVGVRDVEKVLKGAERAGAIAGIGFTAEQSDALKNLLESLVNQAEDRANLVNTVMLNSTRQRYVWAVNSTATEEQKLIEKLLSARNAEELERQLGKVQTALNVATSSVEVGAESRVQALSRTVKQLAQEGITGYIDAGGHHWSPEAYMNMDIRTTIHNTYVQAQKERASEFGVDTFQITSHAGARPLCAPYQGNCYSWDGSSGILHDLYGNPYPFESIYNTSYGEPAGIFGINCGHDPVTFVDGYSIPRYEPTTDFEANAKEYAESQKQRQLERNVRQAKLEAIAQDAAGNKEAFKQASVKVREANARYREYCKANGLTPRNDRLQVYASPDGQGYNRSMSGKVTGTTRGWTPEIKDTELDRLRKSVTDQMRNNASLWDGATEEQKNAILKSLKNADESSLRIIEKSLPNANATFIKEDGTSQYINGTGHINLYTQHFGDERTTEDVVNTWWHEYGHFVDDARKSGSGITRHNVLQGGYEYDSYGMTSVATYDEKRYGEIVSKDVNAFLKRYNLGDRFVMQYDEWGSRWLHYKNGDAVDFSTWSYEDQNALFEALNSWSKETTGWTTATNYLYSQGMPKAPEWGDYYESYRTPKRNIYRTRERFKGAEQAYQDANQAYYALRDKFEATHDMNKLYAEYERLRKIAEDNEKKIGFATDTFDEMSYGAFMSPIIGGHTQQYYATHRNGIEGAANIFMSSVVNDEFITNSLKDLCPNLYNLYMGIMQ